MAEGTRPAPGASQDGVVQLQLAGPAKPPEPAATLSANDLSEDAALASFVLLAKFLGVPAHAGQLVHERGRGNAPWTLEELVRSAKRLKLIARIKTARSQYLPALPLPAIAELRKGGAFILLKLAW